MASLVSSIFSILFFYLMVGVVFCVLFLWKWIGIVDEDAKDSTLVFKLLISPGIVLFWPILLRQWMLKRN